MKDFFIGLLCIILCLAVWLALFLNDANNELKARPTMKGCQCPTQKLCEPVIKVEKPEEVIIYKETVKRDCPFCETCDYSIYNEKIDSLEKQLNEELLRYRLNCLNKL